MRGLIPRSALHRAESRLLGPLASVASTGDKLGSLSTGPLLGLERGLSPWPMGLDSGGSQSVGSGAPPGNTLEMQSHRGLTAHALG